MLDFWISPDVALAILTIGGALLLASTVSFLAHNLRENGRER